MTSPLSFACDLSDRALLAEVERAAGCERRATAHLIALLMEIDARKLYAGQGFSSLFTYCVQILHLSEHAAYLRIEAARLARRFPVILARLSQGSLHVTAVSLLGPHLTDANHVELLDSATHKTKREVEHLVGCLRPRPDVPSVVRKLPTPQPVSMSEAPALVSHSFGEKPMPALNPPGAVPAPAAATRPPELKRLAADRYKVQFTVSAETHEKLLRVQALMRHVIPSGDPSAIFDRGLTLLLAELSRVKFADTDRPRHARTTQIRSRHIPAAAKREVWKRDGGRCAFHGEQGRCAETGFLEFHHVVPYADGGETSVRNLELRCRAHNQYEAERWGSGPLLARERRAHFGV